MCRYGNKHWTDTEKMDRQTECIFVDGPGQADRWVGAVATVGVDDGP